MDLMNFVFSKPPVMNGRKRKYIKLRDWKMCTKFILYQRLEREIAQNDFKSVSQSTISKIENGEVTCNVELFIKILDRLGYDIILQER